MIKHDLLSIEVDSIRKIDGHVSLLIFPLFVKSATHLILPYKFSSRVKVIGRFLFSICVWKFSVEEKTWKRAAE